MGVAFDADQIAWWRNDPIYHLSGTFISSVIDTYQASDFITLEFIINEPVGTNLEFRLRSANTEAGLAAATWYGPTGIADYYEVSGIAINPIHDGHRWIQYKVYFSTNDITVTPSLKDITINYR